MTNPRETETETPAAVDVRRLAPRLLVGGVLAIVVASGLLLFADARELGAALRDFRWWFLLPALALTLWNYALRFFKWHVYLTRLGVRGLSLSSSLFIFFSAFALSITPGKVGEFVKCAFLKRLTGTPVSRSTAAVVAERLTDGLAMILLAAVGALLFPIGRPVLAAAAVAALAAVLLLHRPGLASAIAARVPTPAAVGRLSEHAEQFFAAAKALVGPKWLGIGTALGVVAWLGECAALFLILVGLGVPPSTELLLIATFVLAVSSLAGALSMLPGGLGVAEASVTGMLLVLLPDGMLTQGEAVAATLLIRFATLWFAVLLGIGAMLVIKGRLVGVGGPDRRDAAIPGKRHGGRRRVGTMSIARRGGGGNR